MIYILISIAALMTIALFSNLQLEIRIKFDNEDNYSSFIVRLFRGLVIRHRFNFSLNVSENDPVSLILRKTGSNLERQAMIGDIVLFLSNYYKANIRHVEQIKYLLSRITIEKIYLDMIIGLHNAAQTALVSGAALTLFTALSGYLKSNLRMKDNRIKLTPYFDGEKFYMELNCIINVKLGYIIITKIRMIMHNIKGGEISGRTPN